MPPSRGGTVLYGRRPMQRQQLANPLNSATVINASIFATDAAVARGKILATAAVMSILSKAQQRAAPFKCMSGRAT
jgi:hypothetical protein